MKKSCAAIADNESFQSFILFLIIATAVAMGLETDPLITERYGDFLFFFGWAAQIIFVFEIIVRVLAAPSLRKFFADGWNRFDFIVVALSLIPAIGSLALVARLVRLLRALRVFSASDRMRGFMDRLSESADEILYASLIASVLGYIFAVSGFYLFVDIDPANWGSLWQSVLSVFYLLLLQDVPGFAGPVVAAAPAHLLYFIVFYATFIGLLIGVTAAAVTQGTKKK